MPRILGVNYSVPTTAIADGAVTTIKVATPAVQLFAPSGTILAFGGIVAPAGYLLCDGTLYGVGVYPDLYAAIGVAHGGAIGVNFNVPNMAGRSPIGVGTYTDAVSGNITRAIGAQLGAANHRLGLGEMPSHNHGGGNHGHYLYGNNAGDAPAGGRFVLVATNVNPGEPGNGTSYSRDQVVVPSGTIIGTQGTDAVHNNMQPSLVCGFIIKY